MAFAFVQGKHGVTFSGTSLGVTFNSAVTPGNIIIGAYAVAANTLSMTGFADGTNSYTVGAQDTGTAGSTWKMGYFFAPNIGSGTPTITGTANGSVGGLHIWAEEWSGVSTSSPFDGGNALATAGSGASGQTFNPGSITTTANGDLIWSAGFTSDASGAGVIAHGASFANGFDDTTANGYLSQFQTQGSLGAINAGLVTGTTGLFDLWAVAAAFKAPAGAATPTRRPVATTPVTPWSYMNERASGLLEPVRELWRPRRPQLVFA